LTPLHTSESNLTALNPLFNVESLAALMNDDPIDRQPSEAVTKAWRFYFKECDQRAETYLHRIKNLPVNSAPLAAFSANEMHTMDFRPKLRRLKSKALVIAGRYDFLITQTMAEELTKSMSSAVLEIFEESGHMPFVEEPEKFSQLICNFVEKLPRS
jgi:pimeloyl-ACP methyl ester carboxylesterase